MSRESSLVTADWVEQNLDNPAVVLVEVDEDTTAYEKGHIQGAIRLDWSKDLQDQVRRDFVNREQFSALLSERGVSNDHTVVLYGGNNNWFAAYAYWYFKLYGHEDVKLLDGGRKKWEADKRPYDTRLASVAPSKVSLSQPNPKLRARLADVNDVEFTERLINEAGVAVIPLSPFYREPPASMRFVRLCVAKLDTTLIEAARRINAYTSGSRQESPP